MKWVMVYLNSERISSPPARGAWIEIFIIKNKERKTLWSPPARGAWIEIVHARVAFSPPAVAPRTGGVD